MPDKLKKVLWENVLALMVERYGEENLNRLARDAKIGPGSASRIKEAKTSVGLGIVEKVAKAFDVEPYQLLYPASQQKAFLALCKAYIETDERGREFLGGTAEAMLKRRGDRTGTAD